jgi:FlaA1/EpsC-like NDP-sugar epimerase
VVLTCSHWFDLYDSAQFDAKGEMYFRLFLVPGLFALFLAVVGYFFPYVLPGNNASLIALVLLTMGLVGWRAAYGWLVQQRFMQEKVYILGTGERAQRLVLGLRQRKELGIDVIGWSGNVEGALTRESFAAHLMEMAAAHHVHRVIVAMPDRRGTFPVQELLQLRLNGARIEEATSWLEKISGRIEVEQLYPSWLIFADGFRFSSSFNLMRRALST